MDVTMFSALVPKIVDSVLPSVLPHFSDVKEKLANIENRLTKLEASHEVVRDFLQGGPLTSVVIDPVAIGRAIAENLKAESITLSTGNRTE